LEVPVIVQLVLQGAEVWDPDAIEERSHGNGIGIRGRPTLAWRFP
jgi:hypothetical protein